MGIVTTQDTADPLKALQGLQDRERELADTKRLLIAQARLQGRSWNEIGEVLGVSKQAAWQLFNDEVSAILGRAAEQSGLSDDAAMQLARQELSAVRRQRRSRTAS
ncbi:MAG: hypothetical protein M3468_10975 [Acidobacteriota bacterium]|nr:hypothetical protein [Acidobacteriota bacterium]